VDPDKFSLKGGVVRDRAWWVRDKESINVRIRRGGGGKRGGKKKGHGVSAVKVFWWGVCLFHGSFVRG